MNPYPKGLSDAVLGQSAPTSAGKVSTHFNSPYMKAISQNMMTAIYGSPQDDLTRQRLETSKAQMANYNAQIASRDSEAEQAALKQKLWATKDLNGWIAEMGPEAFNYLGYGSSGSSGSGGGSGGSSGPVDSKEVLRLQTMAAEYAKANFENFDELPHAARIALIDDLAQSFHGGNYTPNIELDYDAGSPFWPGGTYGYTRTGSTDYWRGQRERNPVLEWFSGNTPTQGGGGQSGGDQWGNYSVPQLLSQGGGTTPPPAPPPAEVQAPDDPRSPSIIGSGIAKALSEEVPRGARAVGNAAVDAGQYIVEQLPESWDSGVDAVFDGIETGASATGGAISSGYDYLANTSAGQWLSENVAQPISDAQSLNGPNYSMIAPSTSDEPSIGSRAWDGAREFTKKLPENIADAVTAVSNSPMVQVAGSGVDELKDLGVAARDYGITAQHEEMLRLQQGYSGENMPQEYAIPVGSQKELDEMKADGRLPRGAYYAFDGKLRQVQ